MKDLLLLLAHYPFDPSKKEDLARLLREIRDWDSFVKLVNAHGIIALAAYNIKEAGLENLLPEKAMQILENGLMQSVIRNAWLTERWKEVNQILLREGIKHILLKGMALEHTIYGSKGLRQMTDNDILIRKEESLRAWNLLRQNGFESAKPKSSLHNKIIFETGLHLPALYKDNFAVEIHTRLSENKSVDEKKYNEFFETAVEFVIHGNRAFRLRDDIHLEFLTDHFNRHKRAGECQLRSYTDIKLLDPDINIVFPENFIPSPSQGEKQIFRRAHYKATVNSVTARYRLRFITGDIFPSVKWMKRRYGCSTFLAILKYPQRMGKLLWLN